jgi:Na+/proline symporter
LLILVAYFSREVEYVLNAAFSLRGLTSGALLGSLLLVLLWKKGTALPVVVGSMTSLILMIFVSRFEWTQTSATGEVGKAKLAWPWFTLTGTLVTIGTAWLTRGIPNLLVADFNSDGRTDIGKFDSATAYFYVALSNGTNGFGALQS